MRCRGAHLLSNIAHCDFPTDADKRGAHQNFRHLDNKNQNTIAITAMPSNAKSASNVGLG
jgi:hypothetical protein